jgi:hypothetical protein
VCHDNRPLSYNLHAELESCTLHIVILLLVVFSFASENIKPTQNICVFSFMQGIPLYHSRLLCFEGVSVIEDV